MSRNLADSSHLAISLTVLVLVTGLAYYPGLGGGFIYDDIPNLLENSALKVDRFFDFDAWKHAALSGISGPGGRPLSMVSFALNYYFTQSFDAGWLKFTNLILHCLNGVGVFLLSQYIFNLYRFGSRSSLELDKTTAFWTGIIASAFWLWHPLQISSVLYVVQRMTELAALFTSAGLIIYCQGRLWLLHGKVFKGLSGIYASLLLTALAFLCKENGVLLILYIMVIEFALDLPYKSMPRGFYIFWSGFIGIPLLVGIIWLSSHTEIVFNGYIARNFDLMQRILTEPRVLWFYVSLILLPVIQNFGLFLDYIPLSTGLLTPVSTLLAITGWLVLVIFALVQRKNYPFITLGILGFLAGHSLESSFFGLNIAHEHRNYLPSFFIILAVCFHGRSLITAWNPITRYTVITLLLAYIASLTALRAYSWRSAVYLTEAEVRHHPRSAIAQYEAGRVYDHMIISSSSPEKKLQYYQAAKAHLETSLFLDPHSLLPLFGLLMVSDRVKQPIDPHWIDILESRLRAYPLDPGTFAGTVEFTLCLIDQRCHLAPDAAGRILQATLDNKYLSRANYATIAAAASKYLLLNIGNYEDAAQLAFRAVNADPEEIAYRFHLIEILIVMRQYTLAEEQLKIAKSINKGKYHGKLIELAKALEQEKNATSMP